MSETLRKKTSISLHYYGLDIKCSLTDLHVLALGILLVVVLGRSQSEPLGGGASLADMDGCGLEVS